MKIKDVYILQLVLALLAVDLFSQPRTSPKNAADYHHFECGSTLLQKNNLLQDAGMVDRLKQIVPHKMDSSENVSDKSLSAGSYIIPVVFNVIIDVNNPTSAPSYSQIQMQLASLNAAFSNNLTSLNNVPGGSRAINTGIQFCFAKKAWTNNLQTAWPSPSVGVVYYYVTNSITTNVDITSNSSMASLAALTNPIFPPSKYLNIWCVPNITTIGNTNVNAPPTVIGFGTFPWMTMPIDGVVMRNDCIGNNTYNNFTGNMFPYLDKGNILAHEVGHYLGLFHTFETIVNSNIATLGGVPGCYGVLNPTTEGDLIFDTPPTLINGQVPQGSYNTCNESYFPYGSGSFADVDDQMENFMSYSDDEDVNTFTNKQKERMWGALDNVWATTFLTGQRANLVSSTNLSNTGVNLSPSCGPGLLNPNFTFSLVTSAITCSTSPVQFFQPVLPGYLSATTHTWYFGDNSTSTLLNPLHVYTTSPYNFTATLAVSNGSNIVSYTSGINLPSGIPEIAGWSGEDHFVCRGTEQTILIKFPPYINTAVLSDGITTHIIQSNFIINQGEYRLPFTFTITGNSSWSLSLGSCNVSSVIATFTVVDCCANLVTNGDMEAGPVGFTSQYTLTSNNFSSGFAAVNYPFGMYTTPPYIDQTGKQFMIDAYGGAYGCSTSSVNTLILGQTVIGLQPSTDYYIAFKSNASVDSNSFTCASKFKLKFYCTSAPNLFIKTIRPTNVPDTSQLVPGGASNVRMQVHSFMITTPATINTTTTFSLELYEIDNREMGGFDHAFDNFTVARMNGALKLTPRTSTIMPCLTGTAQLNAVSNCSNISNYSLVWQPSASLSCSNCANPIATVSVTTIYTLVAVPPITSPPSPNVLLTTTVYAIGPPINVTTTTLNLCYPQTYSLFAGGAMTATWQPSNISSLSIVTTPTVTMNYSISGTVLYNQQTCLSNTVVNVKFMPKPIIKAIAQRTLICIGESVDLTTTGANTYTWSTIQTSSLITVSPQQNTTYTIQGHDVNGCPINGTTLLIKVSRCIGLINQDKDEETVSIYPNPTNNNLFIETSTLPLKVFIYDATGKKVLEKIISNEEAIIDMSVYAKGIYLLRLISESSMKDLKVIKLD